MDLSANRLQSDDVHEMHIQGQPLQFRCILFLHVMSTNIHAGFGRADPDAQAAS